MALQHIVMQDITKFLQTNTKIFFNERDLQLNLADFLSKTGNYADIHLEQLASIPSGDIKLDIVVVGNNGKNVQYVPIEIKYRTKSFKKNCTLPIMGKLLPINSIIKNQSAQDLGRYGFWKDVYRIEEVIKAFPCVESGIVLFLTNDDNYITCPKSTKVHYNYEQFSMKNGSHTHLTREWIYKDPPLYKPFSVGSTYTIDWKHVFYHMEQFHYCMLVV